MSCWWDIVSSGWLNNMARYMLVLCMVSLQIGSSAEMPPRVQSCRQVFKAKPPEGALSSWTFTYHFEEGQSCVKSVVLQKIDSLVVNITDPRNCQNFYKCQGLSCQQCPCENNLTFNPVTLRCDYTNAACQCDADATQTTTSTVANTSVSNDVTEAEKYIPPAHRADGSQNMEDDDQHKATDSTNGIVIIVVIVVLTVLILLTLIIGFCLWQRGFFPLKKKSSKNSSNNDGYLHTLPAQERHVYAEIDERTVGQNMQNTRLDEDARRLQHIYAPAMPSNPLENTTVHPHETFVLPSSQPSRLYPQFAAVPLQGYPALPQNRDLIRFSATNTENRGNFSQNNNTACNNGCGLTDSGSEMSSTCSHCSALSNQMIDSQEAVDRRTLLNYSHSTPPSAHFNFVSKQVYI